MICILDLICTFKTENVNTDPELSYFGPCKLFTLLTHIAYTIFLHVLPSSIAKHLWCCWCCYHPIAIDHHLHVLVHGIGPIHKLKSDNRKILSKYSMFMLNGKHIKDGWNIRAVQLFREATTLYETITSSTENIASLLTSPIIWALSWHITNPFWS